MAKADISVNDKRYLVACEDGQEERLRMLAERFDKRVGDMHSAMGDIGTERLFLAAALSLIDELEDAEKRNGVDALERRIDQIEDAAVKALIDAAQRIDRIASKVDQAS